MEERLCIAILVQAICSKPQDRGSSARSLEVKAHPLHTFFVWGIPQALLLACGWMKRVRTAFVEASEHTLQGFPL